MARSGPAGLLLLEVILVVAGTRGAAQLPDRPTLQMELTAGRQPRLTITGPALATNQLQSASLAADRPTWRPLVNFDLSKGSFSYIDTNAAQEAARIYRVVSLAQPASALPTGSILYVSPTGDDSSAAPNQPQQPWRSLTNAFLAARSGDTILVYPGDYDVQKNFYSLGGPPPLLLNSLTNVLVLGVGGQVRIRAHGQGDVFALVNCSDIIISGFIVEGEYQENPYLRPTALRAAIRLDGACSRILIEGNRILHHNDHGIGYIYDELTAPPTNNIIVRNNYIEDVGSWFPTFAAGPRYDGSAIIPAGGWLVENNVIVDCARGIEPFPKHQDLSPYCIIRNNTILNTADFGISSGGSSGNKDIVIEGNHIETRPGFTFHGSNQVYYASGIDFGTAPNARIRNNTISGYPAAGIFIHSWQGTTNAIIEGNVIRNVGCGIFIGNYGGTDNNYSGFIIRGNFISEASSCGIWFQGRDSIIEANILSNIGGAESARPAIELLSYGVAVSSNVTVSLNRIFDTVSPPITQGGIRIGEGATDIRVFGNLITGIAGPPLINEAPGALAFDGYALSLGSTNLAAHVYATNTVSAAGLQLAEGPDGTVGVAQLVNGAATVFTRAIRADSRVFLTVNDPGPDKTGTPFVFSRTPGESFVIRSTVGQGDNGTVAWLIIEPR